MSFVLNMFKDCLEVLKEFTTYDKFKSCIIKKGKQITDFYVEVKYNVGSDRPNLKGTIIEDASNGFKIMPYGAQQAVWCPSSTVKLKVIDIVQAEPIPTATQVYYNPETTSIGANPISSEENKCNKTPDGKVDIDKVLDAIIAWRKHDIASNTRDENYSLKDQLHSEALKKYNCLNQEETGKFREIQTIIRNNIGGKRYSRKSNKSSRKSRKSKRR